MAETGQLKQLVQSQMVAAMKAGDKTRTSVLRMVLSEIKRVEADDLAADPRKAVEGYAKKIKKTMEDMERLKQPERVAALAGELVIIAEFLPKEMEDGELAALAEEALKPLGVITQKDMGKAIGAVMKAVGAKGASADAGKVRALVASKVT